MTIEELQEGLRVHDKGVLKRGAHKPDTREFCALEFVSVMHGEEMHDRPEHMPDIRPLNDGRWVSDESRTQHLLPVLATLWEWNDWSPARQQAWATQVVIQICRQIIAELSFDLPEPTRIQCRNVTTLDEVRTAAKAAEAAAEAEAAVGATRAAAWAAEAAMWAAREVGAARAAAWAAKAAMWAAEAEAAVGATRAAARTLEQPLILCCQIFVEAARDTAHL